MFEQINKQNKKKYKEIAKNDLDFKSYTKDLMVKDVGIAFVGTSNSENCTADLVTASQQFVYEKDGEKKRLSIDIDTKDKKVKNVREDKDKSVEASYNGPYYTSYGGYAVKESGSESSSYIDETIAWWDVPTISDPTGSYCLNTNQKYYCNFTMWTGLTDKYDGSDMIAQVGTNSQCIGNNCASGVDYYGILQWWNDASQNDIDFNVICDISPYQTSFSAGDGAYGKVEHYDSSNLYYMYLKNQDTGSVCAGTWTSTKDPHYGQFQSETPAYSGVTTRTGEVSDFTVTGYFYDNGVLKNLGAMTGSSYDYYEHKMYTGGSLRVDPGSPAYNSFLINYQ